MQTISFLKTLAFVLIASALLLSQQPTTLASVPQTNTPEHEEPAHPALLPSLKPTQQGTTSAQANGLAKPPAPTTKTLPSPLKRAWQILDAACTANKASSRALATGVLGLIPHNPRARKLAEKGLVDDKPEVRSAAATALGEMKSRESIPKLKKVLDDNDPSVALSAAHSLDLMHEDSAYDVYFEILTGQRRSGKGVIATQTAVLKDPKKMAQMGFEEGIGFIPFAGIGWKAIKVIKKDDSSPIRAAAARVLANDPDPDAAKALAAAAGDKSWLVRAAALDALAKRGDPRMLDTVQMYLSDEKDAVKYTAAAALVRLTAIREDRDRNKKRQ
jgi:hypothetical protein